MQGESIMENCEVCLQNKIEKTIMRAIKSHFGATPVYHIFSEKSKESLLSQILATLESYNLIINEKVYGEKK
jgi:hypothetical protein